MMKLNFLLAGLTSIVFANSGGSHVLANDCLFGDDLVSMARYRDLQSFPERTIRIGTDVSAEDEGLIRTALGDNARGSDDRDLSDIVGSSGEAWIRIITDSHSGKSYHLVLSDPGDNIYGGIINQQGDLVARIGDGDIGDCKVPAPSAAMIGGLLRIDESKVMSRERFLQLNHDQRRFSVYTNCYFGRNLHELARIGQFEIQKRVRAASDSERAACYDSGTCAASSADYVILDRFTGLEYFLDVREVSTRWDRDINYGDLQATTNGHIVLKSAPHFVLAKVLAGNLYECRAGFHLYDLLPWFYTN